MTEPVYGVQTSDGGGEGSIDVDAVQTSLFKADVVKVAS